MADQEIASQEPVMILACSGGSNVGQMTNQAAVELTREGWGRMYCLAGLGAGLKGFVKAAAQARDVVVVDGCPLGCAGKIMENAGLPMQNYLLLSDLGIEKIKDRQLAVTAKDVEKVKMAIKTLVPGKPKANQ